MQYARLRIIPSYQQLINSLGGMSGTAVQIQVSWLALSRQHSSALDRACLDAGPRSHQAPLGSTHAGDTLITQIYTLKILRVVWVVPTD